MAEILIEPQDDILLITINRPAARNAINHAVASGMAAALRRLDDDAALRLGIIQGAGGHFCSGMDLKAFLQGEDGRVAPRGFAGIAEKPPAKPLIAAVEGYALAGGFEVALCCDLIVAAENAQFGLPEVKRGLVATAGGLLRLPRQLPYRLALELALTGDLINAPVLHGHGLINHLAPPGQSLVQALELARRIAGNAPLSVLATKRIVTEAIDWPEHEQFSRQAAIAAPVTSSADAREGAAAFAEKRPPRWQGA